ncbi:hypothetical protein [Cytobacillus oceanisediminis]|uniref:hypothetical protein n=1 Tax=Cytobacillus oceanisediminis TaxID=665099 RepID=UPI0024949FDA|nr:hypothetical protein [Cytobacillus oceanisediminis]
MEGCYNTLKLVGEILRADTGVEECFDRKGKSQIAVCKLILLKQNGLKENGWNGTPFWWPVIVAPALTTPTVFAKKTIK